MVPLSIADLETQVQFIFLYLQHIKDEVVNLEISHDVLGLEGQPVVCLSFLELGEDPVEGFYNAGNSVLI